jgi:hypothetical protein
VFSLIKKNAVSGFNESRSETSHKTFPSLWITWHKCHSVYVIDFCGIVSGFNDVVPTSKAELNRLRQVWGPDPYLTLSFSGFQIFFVFTYCRTGKISVFKDKKLLRSQKLWKSRFFWIFLLVEGKIPDPFKQLRILIREAFELAAPTDPVRTTDTKLLSQRCSSVDLYKEKYFLWKTPQILRYLTSRYRTCWSIFITKNLWYKTIITIVWGCHDVLLLSYEPPTFSASRTTSKFK